MNIKRGDYVSVWAGKGVRIQGWVQKIWFTPSATLSTCDHPLNYKPYHLVVVSSHRHPRSWARLDACTTAKFHAAYPGDIRVIQRKGL